jgi:hypothetical protein
MGAVFCRRQVSTLALEQEKVLGNPMIQLKTIELLLHLRIDGVYTGMLWHSMIMQMSPSSGFVEFLDTRVSVRGITKVNESNTWRRRKCILCSRRDYASSCKAKCSERRGP